MESLSTPSFTIRHSVSSTSVSSTSPSSTSVSRTVVSSAIFSNASGTFSFSSFSSTSSSITINSQRPSTAQRPHNLQLILTSLAQNPLNSSPTLPTFLSPPIPLPVVESVNNDDVPTSPTSLSSPMLLPPFQVVNNDDLPPSSAKSSTAGYRKDRCCCNFK